MGALYGTELEDSLLDKIMAGLLFCHALDVLLRVFALGMHEFWFKDQYVALGEEDFAQDLNRFSLVVVLMALIGAISAWSLSKGFVLVDRADDFRFLLMLPSLRILGGVSATRRFIWTLTEAVAPFLSLLWLLFAVFFFFGVLGVTLFRNKVSLKSSIVSFVGFDKIRGTLPFDAHFDFLSGAILTLFQVFTGEGYHEIWFAVAFCCLCCLMDQNAGCRCNFVGCKFLFCAVRARCDDFLLICFFRACPECDGFTLARIGRWKAQCKRAPKSSKTVCLIKTIASQKNCFINSICLY
jgi:hypothetical protein